MAILDPRIHELLKVSGGLFESKRAYNQLCQEIAENIYPLRANFTSDVQFGSDYASMIFDSTPVNAREELGNAISSMLRQGHWFKVSTDDEERDEVTENARALDRSTKMLEAIIRDPRADFQQATKEADHDYVAFGSPVLSVEETMMRDFLRVRTWHPGDCAWMTDDDGEVTVLHRKFKMKAHTAAALLKKGRWNGELDADLIKCATYEPTKELSFVHIVMPVEDLYGYDAGKIRTFGNKPFVSIYINNTHQTVMHERGEPLFPYVVPRWRSLSGHAWGFSPSALNSLPDARMLQQLSMIILEQGEKAIDPPMVGSAEVFTRGQNLYSGGFTYVDLPDGARLQDVMTTVQTSDGLRAGLELKQDVRELITDAFLLNKLYLPSVREMRELEVAVRTEEFRRAALPFFTPIENDYHPRLLGKIFERAIITGLIPRDMFPPELIDKNVRFAFNSPLNQAEGKIMIERYNMALNTIAAGAQVDETVTKLFNIRKMTTDAVHGVAEPDWILSGKEAEAAEQEAAAARQLKEAANVANEGAIAASNVSAASMAVDQAGLGEAVEQAA